PQAEVIHVYPDPVEVGKNLPGALGIAASVDVATEQLAAAAGSRTWPDRAAWLGSLAEARAEQEEGRRGPVPDAEPMHPLHVARAVEPWLDDDSFLVIEVSNAVWWSKDHLKLRRPGQGQMSSVLSILGTGIPYALGVRAASPDSRVVLLSGD